MYLKNIRGRVIFKKLITLINMLFSDLFFKLFFSFQNSLLGYMSP